MKIKTHETYGAVVVEFHGNITGGNEAEEFHQLLHKALDEGKKHVIVDLKETLFMNSSGLGMLISGYTTIKNGGGNLKLANTTEKINSLLVITKLTSVFENYESVEEAVKSFK
jgi:anti-sigma B factor antagonist